MKRSRFAFRMKMGAIQVFQRACDKNGAMPRNQAVGTGGLGRWHAGC